MKNNFYANPAVRQRLVDFLGGEDLEHATCAYLARCDGCDFDPHTIRKPADLDWFLQEGFDIARALYDSESLIAHLDIEYVNFDSPAEVYLDPWRAFHLQEPSVKAIEELLTEWGIAPLHLLTGQGHHFVWRIQRDSDLEKELASLVTLPERSRRCYEKFHSDFIPALTPEIEDAFAGLALVMEFLAHRIVERAAPRSAIPVQITAVAVGPTQTSDREMISIDLSEYGDPLHTRMVRMPFTTYRKPWQTGLARALGVEHLIPKILTIPLHEFDVAQALKFRQDVSDVANLASHASVRIPDHTLESRRLLESYLDSPLRTFHEDFYSIDHAPPETWPETYDALDPGTLPPCAAHILAHPNDLLLKPAGIQLVTRILMAAGWHPRHAAGLIRSKFENPDFDWPVPWDIYDPGMRADFYVRIFSGLYETGLDRLIDLNCTSNQEKGFCFDARPGCSLEPARRILLSSKPHPS